MKKLLLLLLFPISLVAQTSTITWGTTHQVMDGFGGQDWTYATNLSSAQAAVFFSNSTGSGLQIVRTANTYNAGTPDLTTLKNAVANGAVIELGFQSPPCTLKHSFVDLSEACTDPSAISGAFYDGSVSSNGTCLTSSQTLATSYAALATYQVNYINTMAAAVGARIAYIDVQNEPDLPIANGSSGNSSLGSCGFPASAFDTYVSTYLGPALASASWNSTQNSSPIVMLPSQAYNYPSHDYATVCINDANCVKYVGIISGHSNDTTTLTNMMGQTAIAGYYNGNKGHLWASEIDASNQSTSVTGMTGTSGGVMMAQNIHNYLVSQNVSGYEWWELAYPFSFSVGGLPNAGLVDSTLTNTSMRLYVEGNWAKFINNGWSRIDTSGGISGVLVTAFKNTPVNNQVTIVAVNTNTTTSSQMFTLSGAPTFSTVIPNVTCSSGSTGCATTKQLAAQSPVTVTANSFTYVLPASSVVTFTGSTGGSSSCPDSANYFGTTPFSGVPGGPAGVTLANLGITTCFYASISGSDSNSGTSEATPWMHIPGMNGCTANCAAHTPGPGEGYILKGGDSWGSANFTTSSGGIQWNWSGTATNPIYIGVDKTWPSTWNRPIFNAQQSIFGQFIYLRSNWVYVDNIELTGVFYSSTPTATSGTNGVVVCGTNDTLEGSYEHGWSWTTPWTNKNGAGSSNGQGATMFSIGLGCDQSSSVGVTFRYNVLDGSDTQDKTAAVVSGFASVDAPVAYGNYLTWGTWSGLDGCGDNWHDNVVINAGIPLNNNVAGASEHQNMIKHLGACNLTSIFSYNNVVYNQLAFTPGDTGAVKYWFNGACGSYTTYAFNNVVANVGPGNITDFGNQAHTACNSGTIYLFNNSFECGRDSSLGICTYGNGQNAGATMAANLSNNMWITGNTTICTALCPSGGYTFSETNAVYFPTAAAANSQGYTSGSTYSLQPTLSTGSTVGTGTNRSALCTTINALDSFAGASCLKATTYGVTYNATTHTVGYPGLNPITRPSTPDIGSYQFSTSSGSPIASLNPTSLSFGTIKVTTSSTPQNIVLSNTGTATLTVSGISLTGTNPGDYSFTTVPASNCGGSVSVGGSCTIQVTFTPTTSGSRTANIAVTDNAAGSPHTASLSGTGVYPNAPNPVCTPGTGTYSTPPNPVVSCTDIAPVMCYTLDGSLPSTNGTTGCATGNLYSGSLTFSVTTTLTITAGGTGYSDSSPAITYMYTINPAAVAPVPQFMAGI